MVRAGIKMRTPRGWSIMWEDHPWREAVVEEVSWRKGFSRRVVQCRINPMRGLMPNTPQRISG